MSNAHSLESIFEVIHGEDGDSFQGKWKTYEEIKSEIENNFQVKKKEQIILDQNGFLFDAKNMGRRKREGINKLYVFDRENAKVEKREFQRGASKQECPVKRKASSLQRRMVSEGLGSEKSIVSLTELLDKACGIYQSIQYKIERTNRQTESEEKIRRNFMNFHDQRKKIEMKDMEELQLSRDKIMTVPERISRSIALLENTKADMGIDRNKHLIDYLSKEKLDAWQKSYLKLIEGFKKTVSQITSKCDSLKDNLSKINSNLICLGPSHDNKEKCECMNKLNQLNEYFQKADDEISRILNIYRKDQTAKAEKLRQYVEQMISDLSEIIENISKLENSIEEKILPQNKENIRLTMSTISKLEVNLKYDSTEMKLAKDLWRKLEGNSVYLHHLEALPMAYEMAKEEKLRREQSNHKTKILVQQLLNMHFEELETREHFQNELLTITRGLTLEIKDFNFIFKPFSKCAPLLQMVLETLESDDFSKGDSEANKREKNEAHQKRREELQIRDYQEITTSLSKVIERIDLEKRELAITNASLKESLENMKKDSESLKNDNFSLLSQIENYKQEINSLLKENEHLELEQSFNSARVSYNFPNKTPNESKEGGSSLSKKTPSNSLLEIELEEKESEICRLKQTLEKYRVQLEDQENNLKDKNSKIFKLNNDHSQYLKSQEASKEKLNEELIKSKAECERLNGELNQLSNNLKSKDDKISSIKSEMAMSKKENDQNFQNVFQKLKNFEKIFTAFNDKSLTKLLDLNKKLKKLEGLDEKILSKFILPKLEKKKNSIYSDVVYLDTFNFTMNCNYLFCYNEKFKIWQACLREISKEIPDHNLHIATIGNFVIGPSFVKKRGGIKIFIAKVIKIDQIDNKKYEESEKPKGRIIFYMELEEGSFVDIAHPIFSEQDYNL